MGDWTEIKDQRQFEAALSCAKGAYQEGLIYGDHNLSGSTLPSSARAGGTIAKSYRQSRENLLKRMTEKGITWHTEYRKPHGRKILIIGE